MTSLVKQLKRPQSRLKDIIEEEERGYNMLIITFYSSITKNQVSSQRKNLLEEEWSRSAED